MTSTDVLVVGAGAAGLMAAIMLAKAGKKVIVLEARDRIGGRIHTVKDKSFQQPIEAGAEFIHGNLKTTLSLLKDAGIEYYQTKGKFYHFENGNWKKNNDAIEGWDELMERMHALHEDMSIADFLNTYFDDEKYKHLRQSVKGFAEGYDAVDINKASTFSLRKEWQQEDGPQYRIQNGYVQLLDYLKENFISNAGAIHLSKIVKQIEWQTNNVIVTTKDGDNYEAKKIIVTVPISVLQSEKNAAAFIEFSPSIDDYINAAKHVGFGTAIKMLLQFDEAFWMDEIKDAGFILSDQAIPTWWTQLPIRNGLITGWMAGELAKNFEHTLEEFILKKALQSLSVIFRKSTEELSRKLIAYKLCNWGTDPFSCGAYSYATIQTEQAKALLTTPLNHTLFFAGEALYEGDEGGTVEAALASGQKVAEQVLQ